MPSSYQKVAEKSPKSPQVQLQAIDAHRSILQTRLVATLDALDEIQRNHELELEEFRQHAHTLRARSRVLKTRAKVAEAERDGLQEGVNKLVEKEPLSVTSSHSATKPDEEVHRDAYLSSIITSLKTELTGQKNAFAELQRSSDARIATLEAQVARRDAELLQACQSCTCRTRHLPEQSATSPHSPRLQPASLLLSKDEALMVLEETALRHRALEVEVDGLMRKLKLAQSSATEIPTASHPKPPHRAPATSFNPTASGPSTRPTPQHASDGHATHKVLSDIDRQLAGFSKELDGLQAERNALAVEVDGDQESAVAHAHSKDEEFKGILLIEQECIRLRKSERSLRQQLLLAKATASATEQDLKALVVRLQQQVHKLRNPDTSCDSALGEADMDLEDDFLPVTMETEDITARQLGAPLLTPPTRVSTPPTQSSISFQPSWTYPTLKNGHHSPRLPPSGRSPSVPPFLAHNNNQHQWQSAARITRIESELNQARNDVEEKDRAITSLREQLVALEAAVQARAWR